MRGERVKAGEGDARIRHHVLLNALLRNSWEPAPLFLLTPHLIPERM